MNYQAADADTKPPSYHASTRSSRDDGEDNQKKSCLWGKIIVGIILLSVIVFVIVDSFTTKYLTSGFQVFLEWIETNVVAGTFAFMVIYFLATVLFIPASVLTLGGGFIFGKVAGLGPGVALVSSAVFVAASLGAIVSFLLGRYLLKDLVGRKLVQKYPIIQALDEAFLEQGFRICVLLRLSPIIPFNAINYILGVTSTKLSHYTFALFFILPGTVLYCFIGATAGSLTESENSASGPVVIVSLTVGIVFGLLAISAVSYYAKKEFNRIVSEKRQLEREESGFSAERAEDEEQPARRLSDVV